MTAQDQVRRLLEKKTEEGLLHVHFALNPSAKNATLEELCQEVLDMQAAIDAGRFKPLDFGDLNLTLSSSN